MYNKKYYDNNKEKYKEWSKKYRETHLEQCKEYRKRYYQENKERIYQQQREYLAKNKGRFNECYDRSRKKRVAKLKEQGVCNSWAVVNYGEEPRYERKKYRKAGDSNE